MKFFKNRQARGSVLIETAVFTLVFMGFVIYSSASVLLTLDVSREPRALSIASDMVKQFFAEGSDLRDADIQAIENVLLELKYIKSGEDYRIIVSSFTTDPTDGYIKTGMSMQGPNTTMTTNVQAYTNTDPEPGIQVGQKVFTLETGQSMYTIEIFTGQRGTTNESGQLPYYQFSMIIN